MIVLGKSAGKDESAIWGNITGTLSNQTDLQSALDNISTTGINIVDTRANIFTQTPANGTTAFATDTEESFIYVDGWQQESTLFKERTGSIDAGSIQNASRTGYNKDSINGKHLSDITIGSNRFGKEGGARTLMSQSLNRRLAQFFLDGGWQTVLTGVNIATDTVEGTPDIEFTDFSPWVLSLITGNSDALDLEGMPTVQKMKTSAGSRQLPMILDGGTF